VQIGAYRLTQIREKNGLITFVAEPNLLIKVRVDAVRVVAKARHAFEVTFPHAGPGHADVPVLTLCARLRACADTRCPARAL
jgi:hypothetical protein